MVESPTNAEAPDPRLIYPTAVKTVLKLKERKEEEKKGTPETCVSKMGSFVDNIQEIKNNPPAKFRFKSEKSKNSHSLSSLDLES